METRTLTKLSPSKLTTYMTCPVKFYARYVLGIKSPPSPGMLLGRAVHKALELLGRRRQLELDVTLDDALSEFHESWRCELEDCGHELDESGTSQVIKVREPTISQPQSGKRSLCREQFHWDLEPTDRRSEVIHYGTGVAGLAKMWAWEF